MGIVVKKKNRRLFTSACEPSVLFLFLLAAIAVANGVKRFYLVGFKVFDNHSTALTNNGTHM
jgi:hypothetical protein